MALSFARAGAEAIGLGARTDLQDMVSDIKQAAEAAGRPPPLVATLRLDITDRESVSRAAKEIERLFGRLDIVVNNAGIMESPFVNIAEIDPDVWWETLTVNLRGTFLVTKYFLPPLLRGGLKTIVNIGSVGQNFILPGASAYGISKLAVSRLAEFVDAEYTQQGILTYTVHPGAVLTHLGSRVPEELAKGKMTDTELLGADTVVFLTQERRNWLAGRYISATWTMSELLSREQEIVDGNKLKTRMLV
jgi:NAD(P)-dependent dehydrogenase (short-subunit alcohol dehydrogenase family)